MKAQDAIDRAIKLQKAHRLEEARDIYRQILEQRPGHASSMHLLGLTYLDGPEYDNGLELIRQAIEIRPELALFRFNLGVGLRNHGYFEEARQSYQQAVELDPNYGEAWAALVATQKFAETGPELEHILGQLELNQEDDNRRFLHFAASKILDDTGDYENAFVHAEAGNNLFPGRWEQERFAETAAALREMFTSEFLAERSTWGLAGHRPVFVVGLPRSGTSLIEQVLASHPAVFGAGEVGDILGIVSAMAKRMKPEQPYPRFVPYLPQAVFSGYARGYLDRLTSLLPEDARQSVPRFVNKMPSNFLHLGVIRLMFPDARIVNAVRHPLDTCLSCFMQNFSTGQEFSYRLDTLAGYYREYRSLMSHWHEVMPGAIHDLEYEQLVTEPEQSTRALLEFCELPWDEACLEFTDTERRVSTASAWQVRQPLYSGSVGRWRRYERQLQPLAADLAEFLD